MTKARRPFTLPLSDFLVELLERRKAENKTLFPKSDFVFPGTGKTKHMINLLLKTDKKQIGVDFIVHGLRATFINTAKLVVPQYYVMKELVDHTLPKSDVTGGYTQSNPSDLAQPMQAMTDRLLALCNPAPKNDKVVPIKKREQA